MDKSTLINLIDKVTYSDVTDYMIEERNRLSLQSKNIGQDDLLNMTYKYENFISDEMCEWIIHESEIYALENSGWTTKRHKHYPTTDLPVRSIPALCTPLMNLVIRDILPLIGTHYKMNSYFLNVVDLFIVKYDESGQRKLGFHRDGSIISFNILLNDDFEGGGTIINHPTSNGGINSIIHKSKKKDLFIHSGKVLHSGNEITSGKRYIFVGFIEYCFHLRRGCNFNENNENNSRDD